eukprot:177055-Chlamydomonas_euryale.AAC.1
MRAQSRVGAGACSCMCTDGLAGGMHVLVYLAAHGRLHARARAGLTWLIACTSCCLVSQSSALLRTLHSAPMSPACGGQHGT